MRHVLHVVFDLLPGAGPVARARLGQLVQGRDLAESLIEEHVGEDGAPGVTLRAKGSQAGRDGLRAALVTSLATGPMKDYAVNVNALEHECSHGDPSPSPCVAVPVDLGWRGRKKA